MSVVQEQLEAAGRSGWRRQAEEAAGPGSSAGTGRRGLVVAAGPGRLRPAV